MPRDTGPFKIKEQVLVAYTDKHYEAKVPAACCHVLLLTLQAALTGLQPVSLAQVTKAEKRDNLWWYHIHYPVSPRDSVWHFAETFQIKKGHFIDH